MKLWTDENFHGDIVRGVLAAYPDLDIVRVQDTELSGADDAALLEEGAKQGIVIITHDVQTMTKHAYDRVRAGLPMAGVIEVAERMPIGQAVSDLVLIIGAGFPEDFESQVIYVPLR